MSVPRGKAVCGWKGEAPAEPNAASLRVTGQCPFPYSALKCYNGNTVGLPEVLIADRERIGKWKGNFFNECDVGL